MRHTIAWWQQEPLLKRWGAEKDVKRGGGEAVIRDGPGHVSGAEYYSQREGRGTVDTFWPVTKAASQSVYTMTLRGPQSLSLTHTHTHRIRWRGCYHRDPQVSWYCLTFWKTELEVKVPQGCLSEGCERRICSRLSPVACGWPLLGLTECGLEKNFQTEHFRRDNLLRRKDWGCEEHSKNSRLTSWQTTQSLPLSWACGQFL